VIKVSTKGNEPFLITHGRRTALVRNVSDPSGACLHKIDNRLNTHKTKFTFSRKS